MSTTELAQTWGRNIRRRRRELQDDAANAAERRKWTVKHLATEIGISRRHLHAIEAGDSLPSDDVRVRIADALQVNADAIFTYDLREAS